MIRIPVSRYVSASVLALTLAMPVALSPMLTSPAHAFGFGRIVYDPTNYAQNLLTAARTLEQINHQITSLQNEAQMLINQAKNLANLPYSSLQTLQQNVQRTQQLLAQAQNIAFDVQNVDQVFQQKYGKVSLSATDAQLVADALVTAIWRRGKPDALLHHSDRGSQYTSEPFQRLMVDHGVACSMSRSGNCWERAIEGAIGPSPMASAAMESFFGTLKSEFFYLNSFDSLESLEAGLVEYIQYYNEERIKLKLKGLSPVKYREQAQSAA